MNKKCFITNLIYFNNFKWFGTKGTKRILFLLNGLGILKIEFIPFGALILCSLKKNTQMFQLLKMEDGTLLA